jgi:SWI/SNF-related matrix-associated actin-dependent regulator of chromatin subfamily A-like protein 1
MASTRPVVQFKQGVFFVSLPRGAEEAVKQLREAGFRWHGQRNDRPGCQLCRKGLPHWIWWTTDPSQALRLRENMAPDVLSAAESALTAQPARQAQPRPYEIGYTRPNGEAGGAFHVYVPYDARDAQDQLRSAGWRFHGGPDRDKPGCPACRENVPPIQWYTMESAKAERFRDKMLPEAIAALEVSNQIYQQSRADDADIEIPAPAGKSYYGYQRAGIRWIAERSRTLLGDEQGLGKTIQIIGVINLDPSIMQVLIIAKSSLLINWQREAQRWLTRPASIVIARTASDLPAVRPGELQIIITNFERLIKGRGKGLLEAIWERPIDLLAADEVQDYVRKSENQTAQALLGVEGRTKGGKVIPEKPGLVHKSTRAVLATGTPIANRPKDLWPMLRAMAPQTFNSFFAFGTRYCCEDRDESGKCVPGRYGYDFTKASNLDELQVVLRSGTEHKGFMMRRLKAEVLKDLPPKRRSLVVFEPTEDIQDIVEAETKRQEQIREQIEVLKAMRDLAEARGDKRAYDRAVEGLRQAASVPFAEMSRTRLRLGLAKVPFAADYLRGMLDSGANKIVVFANHVEVIDALLAALAEFNPVSVTGSVQPGPVRQAMVDRFMTDPSCRIFIGNLKAASKGLTLTVAQDLVFVEADWVPAENAQAEDRIHRIGTTAPVLIQYLAFEGTMDQTILAACIRKLDIANRALDKEHVAQTETLEEVPVPDLTRPIALGEYDEEEYGPPGKVRRKRELLERILPEGQSVPEYSDEVKQAALTAMQILAGVCDYAHKRDDMGFDAPSASMGHWLAGLPELTNAETAIAISFARRFHGQLPADLMAVIRGDTGKPPSKPRKSPKRAVQVASRPTAPPVKLASKPASSRGAPAIPEADGSAPAFVGGAPKVFITEPDALDRLAALEGDSWLSAQRADTRLQNPRSFPSNLAAWEAFVGLGQIAQDMLKTHAIDEIMSLVYPGTGFIDGAKGRLYVLMPDGELVLLAESADPAFVQRARLLLRAL